MELRIINLIIGLGLLAWSVMWYRENHGAELYAFPVFLFAAHLITFTTVTILHTTGYIKSDVFLLNTWSNGLRLHGLITLALLIYSIRRIRRRVI